MNLLPFRQPAAKLPVKSLDEILGTSPPQKSGTEQPRRHSPLAEAWREIRATQPEKIMLFLRVGDFYETFDDHARSAAPILNVALTKRGDIPMCGIPVHSEESYFMRLLEVGKTIAICNRLTSNEVVPGGENPFQITRLITPPPSEDPAATFRDEIKTNGVAYSNGVKYMIKQGDDEMFFVEVTRNGQRESATNWFGEIENAQKFAIAISGNAESETVEEAEPPTLKQRIASGLAALTALGPFIGRRQAKVVAALIRTSEERDFFIDKMIELAAQVEAMPKTYEQDGLGDQALVHLHYFTGGCDWWITEKDAGDPEDGKPGQPAIGSQNQAFGFACLGDPTCAELGYISLPKILNAGAELDFHWNVTPLAAIKEKLNR